ncbi:hypothetical protein OWV82_010967 [Melia azedarach]|uniref:Uncharacterized protein n=1 Tax=Melia azedarach TaxID=155640 RepID=A0ACC1XY75_MELAZ|nr:hypothetical protein OWV82_010967 [Melia azedarach]
MASSSALNAKSHFHARSNSLPSRPHPIVSQIGEKLCILKSTEEAAATSSSIRNNITGLTDLCDSFNNLLLLPLTQQALAQECNEKQIDQVLDLSLGLMDVCSTTNNALLQIKEDTQELESILRRRRGGESSLANEVGEYLSSRKKANKAIQKSIRDLKSRCKIFSSSDNEDAGMLVILNILREVEQVTLAVFESVLSYTCGTKTQSKAKGWSLVSKLMQSKRVSKPEDGNEFEKVDAELYSLMHQKTRKCSSATAENALHLLENLELSIQDLEEALERLQRRLIKTRVSLLNIINH